MKLPDFLTFEPFNQLRNLMNAPLPENFQNSISINRLTIHELEILSKKGIDVSSEDIIVLDDGTLAYKDSRVLVYIRDITSYGKRNSDLPRFHISHCKTLQDMKQKNRFNRYTVSTRNDGKFEIILIKNSNTHSSIEKLHVCWNCLEYISWKNFNTFYHDRTSIRNTFSIEEYFSKYPMSHIYQKPKYTSADAPLNQYPKNWNEISAKKRKEKNYCCENCQINLGQLSLQKYLHVHHKNGLKSDVSDCNLEVLCIECHALKDLHTHVKNIPDYKDFMAIKNKVKQYLK